MLNSPCLNPALPAGRKADPQATASYHLSKAKCATAAGWGSSGWRREEYWRDAVAHRHAAQLAIISGWVTS